MKVKFERDGDGRWCERYIGSFAGVPYRRWHVLMEHLAHWIEKGEQNWFMAKHW